MYSAVRNHGLSSLRELLGAYHEPLEQLFLRLLSRGEVVNGSCRMRWTDFWAFLNDFKLTPTLLTRLEAERLFKLALQEHVTPRDAHLTFEDFLYVLILLADHGFKDDPLTELEKGTVIRDQEQEYRFRLLLFWIDGSGSFFAGNVEQLYRYQADARDYSGYSHRFAYSRLPKRAVHAMRLCFEKFSRWGLRSNVGPSAKMHMWQFHSFVQHTGLKALLPSHVHSDITFIKVAGKPRSVKFAQFLEIIERVFNFSVGLSSQTTSYPQATSNPDTAGAMMWLKVILEHVSPMLKESGELSVTDIATIRDQLERYLQVFTRPEQTSVEQEVEQPEHEVSLTDSTIRFEMSFGNASGKQRSLRRSRQTRTPQSFDWSFGHTERRPGKKSPRQKSTLLSSENSSLVGEYPAPSVSSKLEAARELLERVRLRKASEASMIEAENPANPTLSDLFSSLIMTGQLGAGVSKLQQASDDLSLSSVEDVASNISGISTNDSHGARVPSHAKRSHAQAHQNPVTEAMGNAGGTGQTPGGAVSVDVDGKLAKSPSASGERLTNRAASSSKFQLSLTPDAANALKPHAYSLYANEVQFDNVSEPDTEASTVTYEQTTLNKRMMYGPTTWERMLVRRNQQTLVVDSTVFLRPQPTMFDAPAKMLRQPKQQTVSSQSATTQRKYQDGSLYQLTSNVFRSITPQLVTDHPRIDGASKGSSPVSIGQSVSSRGKTLSYDDAICDVPRQMGELRNQRAAQVQCYFPGSALETSPTLEQLSQMPVHIVDAMVGLRQTFDPTFLADGQSSVRVAFYVTLTSGERYAVELDEGMWLGIRSRCKLRKQFSEVHGFLASMLGECAKTVPFHRTTDDDDDVEGIYTSCIAVMALNANRSSGTFSFFAIEDGHEPELIIGLLLVRSEFGCLSAADRLSAGRQRV